MRTFFVNPAPGGWSPTEWLKMPEPGRNMAGAKLANLELATLIPGSRFGLISTTNRWLSMHRFIRKLKMVTSESVVLTCQYPFLLPTFRGLGADLTVYDVVDDYLSGLHGAALRRMT